MPSRNSFNIRKMLVSPRRLSLTVAGPGNIPCDFKRYSGSSGSSGDSGNSGDTRDIKDNRRGGQDSPQSSPDELSQEEIDRIRGIVAAARQRLVNEGEEGEEKEEKEEQQEKGEQKAKEERKEDETRDNSDDNAKPTQTPETGDGETRANRLEDVDENSQGTEAKQASQTDAKDASDGPSPCSRDSCDEDALAFAAQRRWRGRVAGNGNSGLCLGKEVGGEGGEGARGRREGEQSEDENGRKGDEKKKTEEEGAEKGNVSAIASTTLTLTLTATSTATSAATATTTTTTTAPRRPKKITKTAKRGKEREGKIDGKIDRKKGEKGEKGEKEDEKEKEKKKEARTARTTTTREPATIRRRLLAPASDTTSCIDLFEALMIPPPDEADMAMVSMAVDLSPTFTHPRAAPTPFSKPPAPAPQTPETQLPAPKHPRRPFLPLHRLRAASVPGDPIPATSSAGLQAMGMQRQWFTEAAAPVTTTRRRRAWARAVAMGALSRKTAPRAASAMGTATDLPAGAPAKKKQRHSGSTNDSGGSGGSRWTMLPDNVAGLLFGSRIEVNEMLSEEELQARQPHLVAEEEEDEDREVVMVVEQMRREDTRKRKLEEEKEETMEEAGYLPHQPPEQVPLLPPCELPPATSLPPPPHIAMQYVKWQWEDSGEKGGTAEAEMATPMAMPPLPLSPTGPFPLDDLPRRIGAAGVRLSVLLPVEEEAAYFEHQNFERRAREQERERKESAAENCAGSERDYAETIRGGGTTPVLPDKNPLRYVGAEDETTPRVLSVPTVLVTNADADMNADMDADMDAGGNNGRQYTHTRPPRPPRPMTNGKGKEKQKQRVRKRVRQTAAAAAGLVPPSSSLRVSSYRTAHGHNEEDAARYVYLRSTPFSMVMPTFRHGPVRLARPEDPGSPGKFQPWRSSQSVKQAQTQPPHDGLDWTAFQMAILGGAGDLFSDSIDYGHRSAADVEELDDLVAWYASLGLGEERLVGEEEEEHAPLLQTNIPLPLPHIVEMPPSEVQRPRRSEPAWSSEPSGLVGLRPHYQRLADNGHDHYRASMASVASYDSMPQSPMADVVLTRGADGKEYLAPPMGHNLGHDLGDFLRWETEHVCAVALE